MLWSILACAEPGDPIVPLDRSETSTSPSPSPTVPLPPAEDPVFTPCSGCAVPTSSADLDLGANVGLGELVVVPDLGGDGADDLVETVSRWDPDRYVYRSEYRVWPDVVGDTPPVVLASSARYEDDHYGTLLGLIDRVPAGGRLWVHRADGPWDLVGLDGVAAATADLWVQSAPDLDGDGLVDLIAAQDAALLQCSGPFAGPVDPSACRSTDLGWALPEVLSTGDLDGDGGLESVVNDPYAHPGSVAWVVDGDGAERGTIAPTWGQLEGALVADLDDDGYDDLVWADQIPRSYPDRDRGEVTVVRGPVTGDVSAADGDLHLDGVGAYARLDGFAAPHLVVSSEYLAGVLLVDGSGSGTVDPMASSRVLGADAGASGAAIGDLDGDGLDDVVVSDGTRAGPWVYLGSSPL